MFYFWVDIDECDTGAFQCDTDQFCVNTEGSYACECYHGYTKNLTTSLCVGMLIYCPINRSKYRENYDWVEKVSFLSPTFTFFTSWRNHSYQLTQ